MAKKNKTDELQPGDMIVTLRNGNVVTAVVTDTEKGISAREVVGPEFVVDGKNFRIE